MAWDAWALLSIIALCAAVIGWSAWGFYWDDGSAIDWVRVRVR
ncbi:hypothetical protein ACWEOI_00900 [Nocardia sp. NPDC004340]